MKKAIPLFLICIFLFNAVGYFIAFKAFQYSVRNEIKSQIKSGLTTNELITININKKDAGTVKWEESEKELFYQDELYDVVRSVETATTITYYCINDKKEKTLFANLDEHVNTHMVGDKPLKNSTSKKLVDHVVKLYFFNEIFLIKENVTDEPLLVSITQINYTPALIETNSPPPEFV